MVVTFVEVLAGLGMFLFGMLYMEAALKNAAGIRFKTWVKNSTSSTFRALLTGVGATALLQSSSVVTLMTLSFVSTSLMSLRAGIAVIFGSNLGTTITAWMVATIGFKLQIETFAIPVVGLGGLILVGSSGHKHLGNLGKILIGFGLLFLGLDVMKTAIETFANNIDLSHYTHYPLAVFVLIGFILTALIQSSSAATAIILSALYAHILSFEQSAAMIIGSNIGTTVTAMLGAIGDIPDKKRAAAAHLLFNFITAILAFLLIEPLTHFVLVRLSLAHDPTTALALFHTLFNTLGVVILTPFIGLLSQWLEKRFMHEVSLPTKYIHKVDATLPETALIALRDEVSLLFLKSIKYTLLIANIKPGDLLNKHMDMADLIDGNALSIDFDHPKSYDIIKAIEFSIARFSSTLAQQHLTPEQSQHLDTLLTATRECVYATKILKDVKNNMDEFAQNTNPTLTHTYNDIRRNLAYIIAIFEDFIEEKIDETTQDEKFMKAMEENHRILKETTLLVNQKGINEKTVVSLLNTNQSVEIASNALREAAKAVTLQLDFDMETD